MHALIGATFRNTVLAEFEKMSVTYVASIAEKIVDRSLMDAMIYQMDRLVLKISTTVLCFSMLCTLYIFSCNANDVCMYIFLFCNECKLILVLACIHTRTPWLV